MTDGKEAKSGGKKLGTIGILGFFGLLAAALFIPTTVLLFIGMLPTIAASLTDRRGKRTKALTVGAMNFAGCVPFLLELWTSDHSIPHAVKLITDPRTVIVIYCAAGIGYLINWAMGGIVATVMIQQAGMRLKDIRKRQGELVERWGPEVTGDLPLDVYGFPIEIKAARETLE
jgi:hypothetical protein